MEKSEDFDFVWRHLEEGNRLALLQDRIEVLGLIKIVIKYQSKPEKLVTALLSIIKIIDLKLKK